MSTSPTPLSATFWEQLHGNAQKKFAAGNHKASEVLTTLEHLRIMCDSILSDDAAAEARKRKLSPLPFLKKAINEASVKAFLAMRDWNGPIHVTIRGNKDYRRYVQLRVKEAGPTTKRQAVGDPQRRIDAAIDSIPSPDERDIVRDQVEQGRQAIEQLSTMRDVVATVSGVDADRFEDGKLTKEGIREAFTGLNVDDAEALRGLLRLLTDNDFLQEFDLKYEFFRVKTVSYGQSAVISVNQMKVLARLAGFVLPSDDGPSDAAAPITP
ncbi:hypothetical protein J2W42_002752 [Rhizobium tibeticum]|uniref:hypothetical protein n=1 Tax=Rhizobium tibeticum TaxID=501024 RepID=UPI00277F5230|nr:hypothetical protein [Rhizobium tibeticum]MDP9809893.1 hypothetical protein [Rhizobium tibeticum]